MARSHPDVLCHGEVFGDGSIGPLDGRYLPDEERDPVVAEQLQRHRLGALDDFLSSVVWGAQGCRAVGFKLKTDELYRVGWADVLDRMVADQEVRVIRLRRRDVLAQYISHEVVLRQSVPTYELAGATPSSAPRPFKADPAHVVAYARDVLARERRADDDFRGHPRFDVDYEDLLADGSAAERALLHYIGVEPMMLRKQTRRLLPDGRSLLENIGEIMAALAAAGFPAGRYAEPPADPGG